MPRADPTTISRLNVLLVEGHDDLHFVTNLCMANQVPDPAQVFTIVDCTGYEALVAQVPERVKVGNEKRVGILVDADLNVVNRWASIRGVLRRAGYFATPETVPPEGVLLTADIPDAENLEPP